MAYKNEELKNRKTKDPVDKDKHYPDTTQKKTPSR